MRYTLFLFVSLLFMINELGFAQVSAKQSNNNSNVKQAISQFDTRDRLILELTHDNWLNRPDQGLAEVKWYSRGFNAYVMYDFSLLKNKNNISIAPGIGIATNNVYHRSFLSVDTSGATIFQPIPARAFNGTDSVDINIQRSKLQSTFIDIPLELRFRTNPNKVNKSFKLALGVRLGYGINAHVKYKGDEFRSEFQENIGQEVFFKDKRPPNFRRIRYAATMRLGYGNFNVFALYSISTLFDDNKGPGIHPFSVGISFNSF